MNIRPRERTAILQSLAAGVVPKIGLHHIQVGRDKEIQALIADLAKIAEGAASIRFIVGPFGSGKTFFISLVRTVALEKKFIVLQADITIDRRLQGSGGAAVALYTELIQNMATRAKPDGGGMPGLVEKFVSDIQREGGEKATIDEFERMVSVRLSPLLDMTHGQAFVRVLAKYVHGFASMDDEAVKCAVRWLRGEYRTKTEARTDLGVRDIIEDENLYDMLKLWAAFTRIAGYQGLVVNLDEMVVLSERLNNTQSRNRNYEVILQILNDCLQGGAAGIGFCFAGTDEFIEDQRRGVFSYEALRTRLAENPFAGEGVVDFSGPVLRLRRLTREEIFVLLERILHVFNAEQNPKITLSHEDLELFMQFCEKRLGAEYFLTPRDVVKQYLGLLNVLNQNPEKTYRQILTEASPAPPHDGKSATPTQPTRDGEDQLVSFKL